MSRRNDNAALFSDRLAVPPGMVNAVRARTYVMYQIWFKKLMPDMRRWPSSVHSLIYNRRGAPFSQKSFFAIAVFLLGNGISVEAIREWMFLREGYDVSQDLDSIVGRLTTRTRRASYYFRNYQTRQFEPFPNVTAASLRDGYRFGARVRRSFLEELTTNRPRLRAVERARDARRVSRGIRRTAQDWANRRAVVREVQATTVGRQARAEAAAIRAAARTTVVSDAGRRALNADIRMAGVPLPSGRSIPVVRPVRRNRVPGAPGNVVGVPLPRPAPLSREDRLLATYRRRFPSYSNEVLDDVLQSNVLSGRRFKRASDGVSMFQNNAPKLGGRGTPQETSDVFDFNRQLPGDNPPGYEAFIAGRLAHATRPAAVSQARVMRRFNSRYGYTGGSGFNLPMSKDDFANRIKNAWKRKRQAEVVSPTAVVNTRRASGADLPPEVVRNILSYVHPRVDPLIHGVDRMYAADPEFLASLRRGVDRVQFGIARRHRMLAHDRWRHGAHRRRDAAMAAEDAFYRQEAARMQAHGQLLPPSNRRWHGLTAAQIAALPAAPVVRADPGFAGIPLPGPGRRNVGRQNAEQAARAVRRLAGVRTPGSSRLRTPNGLVSPDPSVNGLVYNVLPNDPNEMSAIEGMNLGAYLMSRVSEDELKKTKKRFRGAVGYKDRDAYARSIQRFYRSSKRPRNEIAFSPTNSSNPPLFSGNDFSGYRSSRSMSSVSQPSLVARAASAVRGMSTEELVNSILNQFPDYAAAQLLPERLPRRDVFAEQRAAQPDNLFVAPRPFFSSGRPSSAVDRLMSDIANDDLASLLRRTRAHSRTPSPRVPTPPFRPVSREPSPMSVVMPSRGSSPMSILIPSRNPSPMSVLTTSRNPSPMDYVDFVPEQNPVLPARRRLMELINRRIRGSPVAGRTRSKRRRTWNVSTRVQPRRKVKRYMA